jgi:hypothetical protein
MTDAEINRRIAELLEPTPKPWEFNDSHNFPKTLSKEQAWEYPMKVEHWDSCAQHKGGRCDCDASHGLREARPRDFLHDWNCTGMLLERMPMAAVGRNDDRTWDVWTNRFDGHPPVNDAQLQRAVALAFLKMHEGER